MEEEVMYDLDDYNDNFDVTNNNQSGIASDQTSIPFFSQNFNEINKWWLQYILNLSAWMLYVFLLQYIIIIKNIIIDQSQQHFKYSTVTVNNIKSSNIL